MAETESVMHTNGTDTIVEEEECYKTRPADIEADMREMERRKRVEAIMNSRLFREELERIVDGQIREGGSSNILQQLSDIMGMPAARIGSVFKSSNCVVPINDIRGMEAMGYEKGEKILRCKLAATFRLMDLYGWAKDIGSHITARLNADQELFLVNPFGVLNHEITASSLNKVNMQGNVVEQGTTNFGINTSQFTLHSVIHAARPDIRCAIYVGCSSVVAISALKQGLLSLTRDSALLGELTVHNYTGALYEPEEKDKLLRSLGPVSKVLLLSNHGAICCGETVEEAYYAVTHIVAACEAQLKLLPVGLDNLIVIPEETRKAIYDASRKPPEGLLPIATVTDNKDRPQVPKWRVGGAEFEALMRMLDNAGFRTGYIYRNPLVKNDLPKPKNDVEVPPAVSSLGYLIEEEELFKQGIWKKGDFRKGGDRSRWLNSPNVYQKVEVLETGTPDPKKITKWIDANIEEWVAEASPTHSSTPVKIDSALQFVPPNTNPKEFKRIQQQIKDYRRADKISAGPQSHILEGVSWDEANRLKDANVSATGDHVVLMGAASKGIIQRGYQHNATVYKAPYAKNPFDSVTDDELNEYKKTVEKKRHGDSAEHQVLRIETKQVPMPSQPEVVLSDELDCDDTADTVLESKNLTFDSFSDGLILAECWPKYDYIGLMRLKNGSSNNTRKFTLDLTCSRESMPSRDENYLKFMTADASLYYASPSFLHLSANCASLPYRTNSFCGFRSPSVMPVSIHFHIPSGPSKYQPRCRSTSLNDVFGTTRYLSMTEDSYKQSMRRKENFEKVQLHYDKPTCATQPIGCCLELEHKHTNFMDINNNNLERISEVCDSHLRKVRRTGFDNKESFLIKLYDINYSKPLALEDSCLAVDFPETDSDTSFLNHTRELFSDEISCLDAVDIKILQKIEHHSKTYGSLPELYHKIGDEILCRRNYDEIEINSPKVTSATQTEMNLLTGDTNLTMHSSPSCYSQFCGQVKPQPKVIRATKPRRNRNFVLENIERVKTKTLAAKRPTKLVKRTENTFSSQAPTTVKLSGIVRKNRQVFKRRSLQFSTDDEDDGYSNQSGIENSNFQIAYKEIETHKKYIAELGDKFNHIESNLTECARMQDEIDAAKYNTAQITPSPAL